MPLYNIYHPVGAYTTKDKAEFAKSIVDAYNNVIPRFYVGIIFQEIPKDDFYMGAVAKDKFVRIRCDHFARHQTGAEANSDFGADKWMAKIEKAIAPFVRDRGFDWEIHYGQTPRELWRVQGMKPPAAQSTAEDLWIKQNRAVPFEE
jgi:phenylpyruvate tautomerase PptA (4-oxalocrotonate tautomerase family)